MSDIINQDAKEAINQVVAKIERLEQEKQAIQIDIKEVYDEAKSHGLDTKILKQLIKVRKMDDQQLKEQEELLDLYKHAVGMV